MPPVSQAQRAAMHAAAEGKSTLGIPRSVGQEFSEADPGGKLPAHKDAAAIKITPAIQRAIEEEARDWAKFFGVEPTEKNLEKRRLLHKANLSQGYIGGLAKYGVRGDAEHGDPADITSLSERCDAIADSLREVARRLDAEDAYTAGRVAGKQLRGIGSNPYKAGTKQCDDWEEGYKSGRKERENKKDAAGYMAEVRNALTAAEQARYKELIGRWSPTNSKLSDREYNELQRLEKKIRSGRGDAAGGEAGGKRLDGVFSSLMSEHPRSEVELYRWMERAKKAGLDPAQIKEMATNARRNFK